MDRYIVYKRTGTHADALAALGAADVLRHLEPRIVAFEDRFEVQLRKDLQPPDLAAVDPGFSYLQLPTKATPNLPPERIVPLRSQDTHQSASRMYSIAGRMKAYAGPNKVVMSFSQMKREMWEARVWEAFLGKREFVVSSPLVQLFNPHAAQGYALLKPSGTHRRDRTKDRWAEPFLEWLRFRGYFEGCAGWFTSGDLRLFCPIPAAVPHSHLVAAMSAFRDLRLGGSAAKMDCRSVLAVARLLIENASERRRPKEWLSGLWITHYKDMGQAHTLMGMEQLAIPDWFALHSSSDEQLWLRTLQEHDVVLRRLADSHSDELALLKQYRRTFQLNRAEAIVEFIRFLADYGALLFKRRAQDHWLIPRFTRNGVNEILKQHPGLQAIVFNPGFVAVAAAIRSSTYGAQAGRHNGKPDGREVRCGLLSAIRQAGSLGRRELLLAVSSFIFDFNREAERRRSAGLRALNIREGELDALAAVLQRIPAHLNASALLCGVAACSPGKTDGKTDSGISSEDLVREASA